MQLSYGADTYHFHTDLISLHITRDGGHLAPVIFRLGEREVSPYALAPWQPEEIDPSLPMLLKNLRGDFLCLPFGPQENAPPHGETANNRWELVSRDSNQITLAIDATDISAKVEKTIAVLPGETGLYISHTITGLEGDWSHGTHPILDLSGMPEGTARLSVSPFRWASVYPEYFSNPADGATQALKIGALFTDLSDVDLADGGTTDLTHYPVRAGTDDLVMMVSQSTSEEMPFAWSACVMDGYVWFSLKNPADFPATMFWLSNGGRSAPPWNSRHTARLGIEDVCSHFCDGVDISRKDLLRNLSIPTTRSFSKEVPVTLRNIQAVAICPENFGKVVSIIPAGDDSISLTGEDGSTIISKVDWKRL